MKKQQADFSGYPGAILPEAMYTIGELACRLRWDSTAVALAGSKGLKGHVFCDQVYVFGSDVMRFIKEVGEQVEAT
jgi:hypothetical protein